MTDMYQLTRNHGKAEFLTTFHFIKEEYEHCNIHYLYAATPPLGLWCSYMRTLFKITQKGMKAYQSLSQDRIDRLEKIGLLWQGIGYDKATSAVASSEHLKRSFDTAVYLATIQLIQH